MKKIYTLIVLMLFTGFTYAQSRYPQKERASLIMESKLVVQLLSEETETAKFQNQAIQEVFNDSWKFSDVIYASKEEVTKLINAGKAGYAYLIPADAVKHDVRTGFISSTGKMSRVGVGGPGTTSYNYNAFSFSFYNYRLDVSTNTGLNHVMNVGFANSELSKIDYLYLCQQLTNHLESASKGIPGKEFYNVEKNIEHIKKTKLILLDEYFRDKDIKNMANFYDFDFEVVDRETYQDIILNKKENMTYAKIIWSHHHSIYVWSIVNAMDGSTKAITAFGGVKFGSTHEANDIIKAKHLKYITMKGAQKLNNKY